MHLLLSPILSHAQAQPDRRAACDQSLILTYRELAGVAGGIAKRIAGGTERPHVGLLAPTSAVGAAAIVGCWMAGRAVVPLNFLLHPSELAELVRDAELDFVLSVPPFAALAEQLGLRTFVMDGQSLTAAEPAIPSVGAEETAALIYTSGTSGTPKGACLTHGGVRANVDASIAHARIQANETFLGIIPQFHSFGFTITTITPLVHGATAWFLPRFSPAAVVDAISEHRVSIMLGIPSMYAALRTLKGAGPDEFGSLRLAIAGGEPLAEPVREDFATRFGVTLLQGYGLTEAGPVVSTNLPEHNRVVSVGKPLPGVEISILDDDGKAAPAGTDGHIVVRTPAAMRGYWNRVDETAAVLRADGIHTGDVGTLDDEGFLHLTGREKEMMIVGGENVFPGEIEQVLLRHPAVAEAAVVGVADGSRGEVPRAFVLLREEGAATAEALRRFCGEGLARYKVPREVVIRAELPRSATGKILKRELAS